MEFRLHWENLPDFLSALRKMDGQASPLYPNYKFSASDYAVGVLWYRFYSDGCPKKLLLLDLCGLLDKYGLANKSLIIRGLDAFLSKSDYVHLDASCGYTINYSKRPYLDSVFSNFADTPKKLTVSNELISIGNIDASNQFGHLLQRLACQANVCYEYDLPDACAVVCRRLFEVLLVRVFSESNQIDEAKDGEGRLLGFNALIGKANSGKYFSLDKDTKAVIQRVRQVGNDGAHGNYYPVQKKGFFRESCG